MPRYAAAADRNQAAIVKQLRAAGATVVPCHTVGKGFPDLVVGYRGVNYLIEVKDPDQPKHRHELTPQQVEFHRDWRGQVAKVFTVQEAFAAIGLPYVVTIPHRGAI